MPATTCWRAGSGPTAPRPSCGSAGRRWWRPAGKIAIGELARETGWSRQHLGHRFRQEFGPAPKLAARVVRFERARRLLQSVPPFVSIAQVAAVCGYYDHAHLDRDFLELAGCTPSELLAEDLPSFQDDMAPDASSSSPWTTTR